MKQHGFTNTIMAAIIATVILLGLGLWFIVHNNQVSSPKTVGSSPHKATDSSCNKQLSRHCIEIASAEETKFSKLPGDLQTIAIAEISKQAPVCVKDNKLVDYDGQPYDPNVKYAPIGSAIIPIDCGSPSAGLFSKTKLEWQFIERTQFNFTCDAIFNNVVPEKLLNFDKPAECVDNSGQVRSYAAESQRYFY